MQRAELEEGVGRRCRVGAGGMGLLFDIDVGSVRDSWHGDMVGYMYIGEEVATWERECSENVLPSGDERVSDSV